MSAQNLSSGDFSRKLYRWLIPEQLRDRIHHSVVMQSWRERNKPNSELPYILLEEGHIANLQTVLNRNALLQRLPKNGIVAELGVNEGGFQNESSNLISLPNFI